MQELAGKRDLRSAHFGLPRSSAAAPQLAEQSSAQYTAHLAAAKAAASLVLEEKQQAKAAQQAKMQRKGKKAQQKQRKQVRHVQTVQHDDGMHLIPLWLVLEHSLKACLFCIHDLSMAVCTNL